MRRQCRAGQRRLPWNKGARDVPRRRRVAAGNVKQGDKKYCANAVVEERLTGKLSLDVFGDARRGEASQEQRSDLLAQSARRKGDIESRASAFR